MLKDEIKIGNRYNFLTVKELICKERIKNTGGIQKEWYARCLCDCGNEKEIKLSPLKRGITKSCGCYNKQAARERITKYNKSSNKYGTDHPLYQCWKSMKSRNINEYIDEWNKYEIFYEWAIDCWFNNGYLTRIDFNNPYSPNNCCFKTRSEINKIADNNIEKAKQTCLEKYGVEYYTQTEEYNKRLKETSLEKYGVEHPTQSDIVKEKIKNTNLEKYGYEYAYQHPDIQEKHKKTMLEKYGVEYTAQVPEIRQKQINTMLERYGTLIIPCKKTKENKIRDWVEEASQKEFKSNWQILNGKEIDLYNDELKLGIEFCGLYWHSEAKGKNRNYHYDKYKACKEADIRLITIFGDEWNYRNFQVKNFLKSIIIEQERIFARKCSCGEIDKTIGFNFINQHHIQKQSNRSLVYFGLFDKKLIGCVSLRKHHRNNTDLVLDRMCFKDETTVIGGASRLIKRCKEYAEKNNYSKIISWSDNRWSTGNVYSKTGFVLDGELKPDYSYLEIANPKKRRSKQSMTKKNIGCPSNFTESDWANYLGFTRIWDCGKKRWKLDV